MADLVAKAVLTADASGLVGAAKEGEAALDGLNAKANASGGDSTGAVKALESQTTAQKKLAETTQVGRAAAAANVVQLRNVAAASTGLSAATKTATVNGEAMGTMLVGLGRQGGMAGEKLELARASLKALGGVMTSNPILLAATAAAAAVVTLAKATDDYNVSVGRLNIAAQANGYAIAGMGTKYEGLVIQMAAVADVSRDTAREMAAVAMQNDVDPSQWKAMAAIVRDYAAVLGTDVPTAFGRLAEAQKDPVAFAKENYKSLDMLAIRQIENMQAAGNKTAALSIIVEKLGDKIKGAAEQTGWWGRQFDWVGTKLSKLWGFLSGESNKFTPQQALEFYRRQVAAIEKTIANKGQLANATEQLAFYRGKVKELEDQFAADAANTGKQVQADTARWLSGLADKYDQYGAKYRALAAEHYRLRKIIDDPGTSDANRAEAQKRLVDVEREDAAVKKQQRDALLALNPEAQKWAETVKSLVMESEQEVRAAQQSADAAKGRLDAYAKGALALQAYDDEQARTAAVAQLATAAEHAQGEEKKKLLQTIKDKTAAMAQEQAATEALAAKQELASKVSSLSTTGLDASATAERSAAMFDKAKQAAEDWRDAHIKALQDAGQYTQQAAAEIEAVYQDDLQKAYDADLARRKDWASGVASANKEMVRSTQDMASQSKKLLQAWNSTAENVFVAFAKTGKINTTSLVDYIIAELARLAYAKYLASTISSIGSSILTGLASAIGIDTGSTDTLSTVGRAHTGGMGGNPPAYTLASADLFAGAQRHHSGNRGAVASALDQLATNERPVIVTSDEEIVTAADSSTAASALTAPVAVSVQPSQPSVTLNTYNNTSSQVQSTATTDDQGNITIETLVDEVDSRLSNRMYSGRSATGDTMQSLYGARRRVTT